MTNGKAIGPDELPAELPKLGLSDSSHEILLGFHGIIVAVWMTVSFNDWGGGGDIANLSPSWEGTARK